MLPKIYCNALIVMLTSVLAQSASAQFSGYWTFSLALDNRGSASVNISLEETNGIVSGIYLTPTTDISIDGVSDRSGIEFSVESAALGGNVIYKGLANASFDLLEGSMVMEGRTIGSFTGRRSPDPQYPIALNNLEDQAQETLVDVGGYNLKFRVIEGTSPAIVFENGGGMSYSVWARVQSMLRSTTNNALVSYNRAGISGSSNYEGEYDIEKEISGLRKGLEHLNLLDKVVLVGHSYGGLLVRLFAYKYPDEVQSVLFVDPNTAEFAMISNLDERERESFDPESIDDPVYRVAMTKQTFGFPQTVERLSNISTIPTPCKVITSGIRFLPLNEDHLAWRPVHASLADSCDSELIVANRSSHMIQISEPELVVSEILDLLENY